MEGPQPLPLAELQREPCMLRRHPWLLESLYILLNGNGGKKKKNRWCWACQEIAQFHCYPLGQRTVQAYRYPWCEVRRVPVHLLEVQDRGRAQLPALLCTCTTQRSTARPVQHGEQLCLRVAFPRQVTAASPSPRPG